MEKSAISELRSVFELMSLYQYQFPGFDKVLCLCKMLSLWKAMYIE